MDADVLKSEVITGFNDFLCQARKGYKADYNSILEKISFINLEQGCGSNETSLENLKEYIDEQISLALTWYEAD